MSDSLLPYEPNTKVSEEGIASDLSYIMNSTSGFLSFEEAEVAMDISLYVARPQNP